MGWILVIRQVSQSVGALIIAGFSLIVMIVARTIGNFSLDVAERSTRVAKRSGEAALERMAVIRLASDAVSAVSKESDIVAARPWIGISNIEFREVRSTDLFPEGVIILKYHNTGSLPAHSVHLDLSLYPSEAQAFIDCDKTPIEGTCVLGGILPNEPTDRYVPLPSAPRYRIWRERNFSIAFIGCIRYTSGVNYYRTSFDGRLAFAPGESSLVSWNNTAIE